MNTKLLSRSVVAASTLAITLFTTLYAAPASAYGRGGHYYGHGRGHSHVSVGIGVGLGVGLGLGLYHGFSRPYYYSPVYYDYPYYPNEVIVRTVPAPTTVYIEDSRESNYPQNSAPSVSPSAGGNVWYYCHNPDGFYPSIKSCPSGWQKVPASPPPSEQ